ncbi:MAG: sensor histidine kinase [Candidatus Brocadiales bacterium]
MHPFRSLKGKLLVLTLCLSLTPIALITTIYHFHARNTLKKQTLDWMTSVAESRRAHIIASLESEKERISAFASDGFIRDSLKAIVHKEAFSEGLVVSLSNHLSYNKKSLDPHILEISVANKDGIVVAATNKTLIGKDISDQEAFLQAINKNQYKAGFGQPVHIPYLQADCIFFSALVTPREGGDAIGVIINTHILAALSEITISRVGMRETGEVYLVNKDRLMLTESRFIKGAPLKQVVDTEPVRKIVREGKEMTGIYPDYRGVPIVGASAYIPEYGWTLLAEIDEAEAFAPIRTLGIIAMITGGISAAIVIGMGIIFALSISRPIKRLTDATIRFGGGDLDHRIKLTRTDEIGVLADGFNTMAQELKTLNQNLEQRVTERTAELTRANEKLQREIVERKRTEKKLEQTAKNLARSNQELQQFSYVAAHDLQEPLRMVASYTQLLQQRYKGKLGSDADDFIFYAVDGAKRMQQLINDLLAYSRVETHTTPFKPIDSTAAFVRAVINLQAAIEKNGAVVTNDTLPIVMANDAQLVQVFQNLISNAIKFRGKEPPCVHASAEQKENEWVFSIRDNGIGINPQYVDRIFVIFQRLHGKTKYPGSGIGLAICKKIVEHHGGRIWVESEPGKGATFCFTLPPPTQRSANKELTAIFRPEGGPQGGSDSTQVFCE